MPPGQRDSNVVRASVYDAFVQLGGLNEGSLVKQYMFGESSAAAAAVAPVERGRGPRIHFRERAPMIAERMVFDEAEEEENGGSSNSKTKSSGLFSALRSRSRSKSKTRTREKDDRNKTPTSPSPKSPKGTKRLFSRKADNISPVPALPTSPSSTFTVSSPSTSSSSRLSETPSSTTTPTPSLSPPTVPSPSILKSHIVTRNDPQPAKLTGPVTKPPHDENKATKRLSIAIPNSAFRSSILFPKQQKNRDQPELSITITEEPMRSSLLQSHSLPPSPFLLVSPDTTRPDDSATPYTLCSPVDASELREQLSSSKGKGKQQTQSVHVPLVPVSVSKVLRDTNDTLAQSTSKTFPIRGSSLNPPPKVRRSKSLRARESPFPMRPIRTTSVGRPESVLSTRYKERYESKKGSVLVS